MKAGWAGWRDGKRFLKRAIYYLAPLTGAVSKPVFIVGCGRSGTTILGELISQHPAVLYLNEPYLIWELDPRTDIWTERAKRRRGRLELTANDVKPLAAKRIRKAFQLHLWKAGKQQIVEKLPINSFRLGFLMSMFPDARVLHIIRNGAEVARSISKFGPGEWYGFDDYKWHQLASLARSRGEGHLLDLCRDDFTRGLLEWRLSVTSAFQSLEGIPGDRRLELRYEALLTDPGKATDLIIRSFRLPDSPEMKNFAARSIGRQTSGFDMSQLTAEHLEIAGHLLARLGYLAA